MTIYNNILENKIKTYLIIAVFIAIISGFFFLIGQYFDSPNTYFFIGFVVSVVSSIGSYFFSDKIVLATSGAKPATKEEYFDFYTVTENLSLAAGLPMPKLYVIPSDALNAFATGRDPKHAVVAATTGLLQRLERSELEGVIAHELSHIKNYDILLSSIVAVLVGTVALVADWITRSLFWGGGRREDNNSGSKSPFFLGLFFVVLIFIPIVATLIQLAVSRRREFLADASGSLITRHPEGLARALEKIAGDRIPLHNANSSTAHLYTSNPFKKGASSSWLTSLFSTHPPVDERIRILRNM